MHTVTSDFHLLYRYLCAMIFGLCAKLEAGVQKELNPAGSRWRFRFLDGFLTVSASTETVKPSHILSPKLPCALILTFYSTGLPVCLPRGGNFGGSWAALRTCGLARKCARVVGLPFLITVSERMCVNEGGFKTPPVWIIMDLINFAVAAVATH